MAEYNRIAPSQFIPLAFQLFDGTSAPTRFVRSVILKSSDRSTKATKDLTDNGNGDFSLFSVTPTSLGIGENNFFEVITTVYSDSGYTTVDIDYAVEKEVYYVKEETSGAILGGESRRDFEVKIDYKKLAKAVWEYTKAKTLIEKLNKVSKKNTIINESIKKSKDKISEDINSVAQMVLKASNLAKENTDKSLSENTKIVLVELEKMAINIMALNGILGTIKNMKISIQNSLNESDKKANKNSEEFRKDSLEILEKLDKFITDYSDQHQKLEKNLLINIKRSDVTQQIALLNMGR